MFDPHPYQILELDPTATNAEVLKAFVTAMQRKQYSPDLLMRARKILLDPVDRVIADYLWSSWQQLQPAPTPNPAVLDILAAKIDELASLIETLAISEKLTPTLMAEEIITADRLFEVIAKSTFPL
jgi:hypothetical protein